MDAVTTTLALAQRKRVPGVPRLSSAQSAEVIVTLRDGHTRRRGMRDLVPASAIEATIDSLESQKDVGMLAAQLSLS